MASLNAVLIFTETYFPEIGGGETQARLLAEGLVAKGHAVHILTRRSRKSLKKAEPKDGYTIYRIGPSGSGQLKKWGMILTSIPLLFRLRKDYDVIFAQGFRIIGMTAVLLGKWYGKPCVLKSDSLGEMSGEFFTAGLGKFGIQAGFLPFKWFLAVRNAVLRRAAAFVAIFRGIVTEYEESGVPSGKIRLVPNCVDTRRFFRPDAAQKAALRRHLGIPVDATVAIYTGRLVSYKGLPLLLKVWKSMCAKHPDLYLLLVGTGGLDIHNCEAELRAYVWENGLAGHVRFTGSVQNVDEYLQAADLYTFPTENDAFPGALIEAMVSGLPVIATPVGAIEEIISDQKDGLIIAPGDFDALQDALERLVVDPSLRRRLGESAVQTVQEKYSASIVTRKYIELFNAVIQAGT